MRKNLPAMAVVILMAAALLGVYQTRNAGQPRKPAASQEAAPVDEAPLETARRLASLADTAQEQDYAREALHLADQALDQAFATALREAEAPAPPASGPLRDLAAQIDRLKGEVTADQSRIAQLTRDAAASAAAGDQLELAKAQLALDQDELDDAQQDLARQGGDRHASLEQALQAHETEQQTAPQFPRLAGDAPGTMSQQVQLWLSLGSRDRQVVAAEAEAAGKAAALLEQHNALESRTSGAAPAGAGASNADRLARLRLASAQRKTMMETDKRIQDYQQLAGAYQGWSRLVDDRRGGALNRALRTACIILAILLVMVLTDRGIGHAFHQTDRKRLHQLRVMATVATQLAAALIILLIVFGPPTQLSTIIGLATAGITVVMKDFIVAFFGWFTLMGKNGIHLGDWVEIEGVSGEVIEIGVLKTVLLEMGNWTEEGHPTGRQVTFSNSFAMEGHYFNFSTFGAVAVGRDPGAAAGGRRSVRPDPADPRAGAARD